MQALLDATGDPFSPTRLYAIRGLAASAKTDDRVLRAIRGALEDEDNHVRFYAAESLWKVERNPVEVLPVLRRVMREDKDGHFTSLRGQACELLRELGPIAAEAVPELIYLLDDRDAEGYASACWALARLGSSAASAVPALIAYLGDRHRSDEVARALEGIGAASVPALAMVLRGGSLLARWRAAVVLARLGADALAARASLEEAASRDTDADVRALSALALVNLDPAEGSAAETRVRALARERIAIQRAAVWSSTRLLPRARALIEESER